MRLAVYLYKQRLQFIYFLTFYRGYYTIIIPIHFLPILYTHQNIKIRHYKCAYYTQSFQ